MTPAVVVKVVVASISSTEQRSLHVRIHIHLTSYAEYKENNRDTGMQTETGFFGYLSKTAIEKNGRIKKPALNAGLSCAESAIPRSWTVFTFYIYRKRIWVSTMQPSSAV
jgi:hypothetical protein